MLIQEFLSEYVFLSYSKSKNSVAALLDVNSERKDIIKRMLAIITQSFIQHGITRTKISNVW